MKLLKKTAREYIIDQFLALLGGTVILLLLIILMVGIPTVALVATVEIFHVGKSAIVQVYNLAKESKPSDEPTLTRMAGTAPSYPAGADQNI